MLKEDEKSHDIPDQYLLKAKEKVESQEKKRSSGIADSQESHDADSLENDIELKKLQIGRNYAEKHKKTILQFFKMKDPHKLRAFLFSHPELLNSGVLTWSLIKMVDYQFEDVILWNTFIFSLSSIRSFRSTIGWFRAITK